MSTERTSRQQQRATKRRETKGRVSASTRRAPSADRREPPVRWITAKSGKRYWFDRHAANTAVAWIESYCHHTEGEWLGRPFILARWQRRIVRRLFGWKRPDGTRRYRRLWLEVPRKNGKTEFAAALALFILLGDGEPSGQVYSVATDKDQARIVFDKASKMIGMSPDLVAVAEVLKPSIWCNELLASFKPLSKAPDSKHGFSPSGIVGDEVHVWTTGELYEVVHEGEGARAQPLDILITSAGKRDGFAWEAHEHALSVIKGEAEDDELLAVIYAAAEEDDWTSEIVWAKANPNLDVSPKRSFLQSECAAARRSPRKQNRFRQFYLDQWTGQAVRWVPMESWDVCTRAPSDQAKRLYLADEDLDEQLRRRATALGGHDPLLWKKLEAQMVGRTAYGGLDLATVRDIASLCWQFDSIVEGGPVTLLWRFYLPTATLKTLNEKDRKRYEAFVAAGALTLTPGNVADYGFIKKQIMKDSESFRIKALGIDRWNATQLATDLLNDEGLPVELFGQGFASMSGPSKDFERRFLGLEIEHGNNPVARWMADNTAVDEDAHDNIKPTKERSAGKIDGIVAAIMARGMAMAHPEPKGPDMDAILGQPALIV